MYQSLFGRREQQGGAGEWRDRHEVEALPDMEAAPASDLSQEIRRTPPFRFEEPEVHPEGMFTGRLVSWQPEEGRRVVWRFRSVPPDDTREWDPVPFVTGTTCRPDNNLHRLLRALGVAAESAAVSAEGRAGLRERLQELDPETLVGRECRIEVEHARDELGDVVARIRTVAPPDWI